MYKLPFHLTLNKSSLIAGESKLSEGSGGQSVSEGGTTDNKGIHCF